MHRREWHDLGDGAPPIKMLDREPMPDTRNRPLERGVPAFCRVGVCLSGSVRIGANPFPGRAIDAQMGPELASDPALAGQLDRWTERFPAKRCPTEGGEHTRAMRSASLGGSRHVQRRRQPAPCGCRLAHSPFGLACIIVAPRFLIPLFACRRRMFRRLRQGHAVVRSCPPSSCGRAGRETMPSSVRPREAGQAQRSKATYWIPRADKAR
jgi:hypothetical protein